jgi:hypothetical protein
MVNMQCLDLGEYATDEALYLLYGYMPLLHTLLLAHNYGVTDEGLADIGADTNRCLNLKLLDITRCNGSTYSGTLPLRRQLRHPEMVIRRQPKWMDGKYATPDGFLTCWADGTFEYARDFFNFGFVAMFFEWQQSHNLPSDTHPDMCPYGRRLQFVNDPPDWDAHRILTYTAGVACVPVLTAHDAPQSVVVAQSLRQLQPPFFAPARFNFASWPIGESRYFKTPQSPSGVERTFIAIGSSLNADVKLTRMKVTPIDQLMPPQQVVQEIEHFLALGQRPDTCLTIVLGKVHMEKWM